MVKKMVVESLHDTVIIMTENYCKYICNKRTCIDCEVDNYKQFIHQHYYTAIDGVKYEIKDYEPDVLDKAMEEIFSDTTV